MDAKILRAEQAKLALQAKMLEIKDKFHNDDSAKMIANILHEMHCHWNHTDGCGWFYFDWDREPMEYSKKDYLDKANRLIEMSSHNDVEIIDQCVLQYIVHKKIDINK